MSEKKVTVQLEERQIKIILSLIESGWRGAVYQSDEQRQEILNLTKVLKGTDEPPSTSK